MRGILRFGARPRRQEEIRPRLIGGGKVWQRDAAGMMPAPPGLGFGLTYYTVHYTVFTSHGGPEPDGSQTFPGTICRTGGVRPSRNDYGARERLVFAISEFARPGQLELLLTRVEEPR